MMRNRCHLCFQRRPVPELDALFNTPIDIPMSYLENFFYFALKAWLEVMIGNSVPEVKDDNLDHSSFLMVEKYKGLGFALDLF